MVPRTSEPTVAAALVSGLIAALSVSLGCNRETDNVRPESARVLDYANVLSEDQRLSIADYLDFVVSERGVDYRVVAIDEATIDLPREGAARYERIHIGEHMRWSIGYATSSPPR
jgi:hypothetical protein